MNGLFNIRPDGRDSSLHDKAWINTFVLDKLRDIVHLLYGQRPDTGQNTPLATQRE